MSEPSLAAVEWRLSWRRDRVLLVMLAVAVALRVLATFAFRPGLMLFGDSYSYVRNAQHLQAYWFHPLGYPVFLRLLWWTHFTVVVVVVQHLLGLAAGVAIYLLLRRAGLRPAFAALGVAPVLLDAYEVDVEQFLLSDTLFLVLIVLALALVLVPERPSPLVAGGAGLALAAAALTRGVGGALLLPVVAYLLVRRVGWRPILAFVAAVILPVVGYMVDFHTRYHSYALETTDGLWLYGHTATFARCDQLPGRERPLCPAVPVHLRRSSEYYTWAQNAPLYRLYPPAQRPAEGRKFALSVIRAQPLDYLQTTVVSVARDFSPLRSDASWAWPVEAWQMTPAIHPHQTNVELARRTLPGNTSRRVFPYPRSMHAAAGAGVLAAYQRVFYAWGPTLALGIVLPVVAVIVRRSRRRRTTAVALTLGAAGGLLLLIPSLTVTQDYRYMLPAQALLWPAALLAASALWPSAVAEPTVAEGADAGSEI